VFNIAVVIPAYNAARTIGRALASVKAQTVQPAEIIIVDDGSTDETATVVAELSVDLPIRFLRQSNGGAAAARQTGSEASTAEYIAYLDADDWWPADKLEQLQNILAVEPVDFLIADLRRIHEDRPDETLPGNRINFPWAMEYLESLAEQPIPGWYKLGPTSAVELLLRGFPAFPPTFLVKRSALMKVGGWNRGIRYCEDFDLALRLCDRFGLSYLDRPMAIMGLHSGNDNPYAYIVRQMNGGVEVLKSHHKTALLQNKTRFAEAVSFKLCSLAYALKQHGDKAGSRERYRQAMFWPGKRVHAFLRWAILSLQSVAEYSKVTDF